MRTWFFQIGFLLDFRIKLCKSHENDTKICIRNINSARWDSKMDLLGSGVESELRKLLGKTVTSEACEECKVYTGKNQVEKLTLETGLMVTIRDSKAKYRDALREQIECVSGKISAMTRLREQAVLKADAAETERRKTRRECDMALGKKPAVRPRLPLPDINRVQAELTTLHHTQAACLSVPPPCPHCSSSS